MPAVSPQVSVQPNISRAQTSGGCSKNARVRGSVVCIYCPIIVLVRMSQEQFSKYRPARFLKARRMIKENPRQPETICHSVSQGFYASRLGRVMPGINQIDSQFFS